MSRYFIHMMTKPLRWRTDKNLGLNSIWQCRKLYRATSVLIRRASGWRSHRRITRTNIDRDCNHSKITWNRKLFVEKMHSELYQLPSFSLKIVKFANWRKKRIFSREPWENVHWDKLLLTLNLKLGDEQEVNAVHMWKREITLSLMRLHSKLQMAVIKCSLEVSYILILSVKVAWDSYEIFFFESISEVANLMI